MSPAYLPVDPADDSRKPMAAAGLAGGVGLALVLTLVWGLMSRRVRWSDGLRQATAHWSQTLVAARQEPRERTADRLRNAIQLHGLRPGQGAPGGARVIAVARPGRGGCADLPLELARSFARARLRTLIVDAAASGEGPTGMLGFDAAQGWREALDGGEVQTIPLLSNPGLAVLPWGGAAQDRGSDVSLAVLRETLARVSQGQDVVILVAGSVADHPGAELLLSVADVGVAHVLPEDHGRQVMPRLPRLDALPRHGSILLFDAARRGDPGLHP